MQCYPLCNRIDGLRMIPLFPLLAHCLCLIYFIAWIIVIDVCGWGMIRGHARNNYQRRSSAVFKCSGLQWALLGRRSGEFSISSPGMWVLDCF